MKKKNYLNDELMLACVWRHADVALKLIESGADVHATNDMGDTALVLACRSGLADVALKLIESGADVHATNDMGDTALMLACSSGLADVALKLIEGGAYVHAIMEVHAVFVGAHTALMPACSMGLADVVKALLVHGAGANVTHNHTTLMEIALRSRDPESVQNILKLNEFSKLLIQEGQFTDEEIGAAFTATPELSLLLADKNNIKFVQQLLISHLNQSLELQPMLQKCAKLIEKLECFTTHNEFLTPEASEEFAEMTVQFQKTFHEAGSLKILCLLELAKSELPLDAEYVKEFISQSERELHVVSRALDKIDARILKWLAADEERGSAADSPGATLASGTSDEVDLASTDPYVAAGITTPTGSPITTLWDDGTMTTTYVLGDHAPSTE